ncbi:MAG: hypothetical protein IKB39_09545 [Bacteroidaceae bacterium]|nr:hypothetical protein [Bacteroidaceae bacterium]MBR2459539.1 hypothetical protein [Bacteroidaceae bacterium]
MKNLKILYFALPVWVILMCIPFEINADKGMEVQLNANVLYIFRMLVILFSLGSMVSAFTILKERLMSQLVLLAISALWVVIDYYMNLSTPGSDNLLWLLRMIVVVYVLRYKAVSRATYKQKDRE